MNDAFARLTDPIFQYVIDFQHSLSDGETPVLKEVKAQILDLFAEADARPPRHESWPAILHWRGTRWCTGQMKC